MGSQLLEREVHRQENELSTIKAKLHKAQDRILELEKEKEDRYTKIKAEVYENSMQLLHGFQRSHNEAQEQSMRRIAHLEKELDQVKADSANVEDVRRALEERQDECKELTEALEELELQQSAEREERERERGRAIEAARLNARIECQQQFDLILANKALEVARAHQHESRAVESESEHTSRAVESESEHTGAGDGPARARGGQEVEDTQEIQEHLDKVCEERDQLQHRCCDAEERNRRLEAELQKMMELQRQMDAKFNRYQMEHQIVLEMEARNRQWQSPSTCSSLRSASKLEAASDSHQQQSNLRAQHACAEEYVSSYSYIKRDKEGGCGESSRKHNASVLFASSAVEKSGSGGGEGGEGAGGAMGRERERERERETGTGELFLQNQIDYLHGLVESRDGKTRSYTARIEVHTLPHALHAARV
jgi:hypothetical protein